MARLLSSTFGLNGYMRITATGASLADIRTEYMALWIQAGIYFLLTCLFYHRRIAALRVHGAPEKLT